MQEESLSLYTRNRETLLEAHPALASVLPESPDPCAGLQVMEGKRGLPTLQASDDQGVFYLHSPYDPRKEAITHLEEEFAANELEEGQTNFIVLMGFGLGYLVEELLHRVPKKTRVVVALPDPVHFQLALSARDLSSLWTAENVRYVSSDDPKLLGEQVALHVDFSKLQRWKMVLLRPMMRLYPAYSRAFVDSISSILNVVKLSLNTNLAHSHQFLANALRNIWWVYNAPGIDSLVDRWKNRPAVIVAAGPSLDKQLPLLHDQQDRILIFAALQAVPTLRKAGITPHIIVVVDPKHDSTDFQSEPGEGFQLLAVDIATHPGSVRHGHGKLIVGHATDENQEIFRDLHGTKGVWNAAGSVATNAFQLAVRCGAAPILLIGQDLALTGGRSHGESYRHGVKSIEQLREKDPNSLQEITGYYDDRVLTTPQYALYRTWFENRLSALPEGRVINCTEGGARIHGAVQQPFAEALHACALETDINPAEISEWGKPLSRPTPKALKKNLARMRSAITEIEKRAIHLRKLIEREIKQIPEDAPSGLPVTLQRPIQQLLKHPSSAVILLENLIQPEIFGVQRALEVVDGKRLEQLQAVQQLAMACIKASRDAIEQLDHLPTPANG